MKLILIISLIFLTSCASKKSIVKENQQSPQPQQVNSSGVIIAPLNSGQNGPDLQQNNTQSNESQKNNTTNKIETYFPVKDYTVTEMGVAKRDVSLTQQKQLAKQAAIIRCQRALVRILQGAYIEGKSSLKNGALEEETINEYVQGIVRGAEITNEKYLSDYECEVTMKISADFIKSMNQK